MKISSLTRAQGLHPPHLDYYAFRGLAYGQFQAIQVIYALFSQLINLPLCSEEILVVRHKTQFWLNELHAAYSGSPAHPITQDLQSVLKDFPLEQEDWIALLTAIEMDIDGLLLENDPELRHYANKLYGSLFRLIATVLQPPQELKPDCSLLAYARTLLMFIQHPHRKGVRFILPENIPIYTLFEEAGRELQQSRAKSLKPLLIYAGLYRHQAKEPMVKLGPLKILWLSICERLSSSP